MKKRKSPQFCRKTNLTTNVCDKIKQKYIFFTKYCVSFSKMCVVFLKLFYLAPKATRFEINSVFLLACYDR